MIYHIQAVLPQGLFPANECKDFREAGRVLTTMFDAKWNVAWMAIARAAVHGEADLDVPAGKLRISVVQPQAAWVDLCDTLANVRFGDDPFSTRQVPEDDDAIEAYIERHAPAYEATAFDDLGNDCNQLAFENQRLAYAQATGQTF